MEDIQQIQQEAIDRSRSSRPNSLGRNRIVAGIAAGSLLVVGGFKVGQHMEQEDQRIPEATETEGVFETYEEAAQPFEVSPEEHLKQTIQDHRSEIRVDVETFLKEESIPFENSAGFLGERPIIPITVAGYNYRNDRYTGKFDFQQKSLAGIDLNSTTYMLADRIVENEQTGEEEFGLTLHVYVDRVVFQVPTNSEEKKLKETVSRSGRFWDSLDVTNRTQEALREYTRGAALNQAFQEMARWEGLADNVQELVQERFENSLPLKSLIDEANRKSAEEYGVELYPAGVEVEVQIVNPDEHAGLQIVEKEVKDPETGAILKDPETGEPITETTVEYLDAAMNPIELQKILDDVDIDKSELEVDTKVKNWGEPGNE